MSIVEALFLGAFIGIIIVELIHSYERCKV